jgi:parallel beta-helix repeat protein
MKKQLFIHLFTLFCAFYANAQVVNVSTASQLSTALSNAKAGQAITLADGLYVKSGGFVIAAGINGTVGSPIKLVGSAKAIISSGNLNSGYGISMQGNSYWVFQGFSIHNSAKGIVIDNSKHNTIDNLRVTKLGIEGIHLRTYSSHNTVSNCYLDSTGCVASQAGYAEGIYIGSANSNWANYTNGDPDTCNYNIVTANTFGDHIGSENIDIKEGTVGGTISYNQFNGKGCNGANSADSWIDLKGNYYIVSCNTGVNNYAGGDGFQTHIQLPGYGDYNTFSNNTLNVGGSGYGILVTTSGSQGIASHNKVCSNNTVKNATAGLTNISASTCATSSCALVTNIAEQETPEKALTVSPNPFDQYIELSFSKLVSKLELSDMNGRIMMQEILNGETSFRFTTSALSAGFYYIKINYLSGTSEIRKVMKM